MALLSIALVRRRQQRRKLIFNGVPKVRFSSRPSHRLSLRSGNSMHIAVSEERKQDKVTNEPLGLRFRKYFMDSTVISTAKE